MQYKRNTQYDRPLSRQLRLLFVSVLGLRLSEMKHAAFET